MVHALQFVVGVVILGIQYYLSRRNNTYWGAILPVIYIACFVYGKLTGLFNEGKEMSMILAALGGTALLLLVWIKGRTSVKDKRRKELEKIELHDL
ncbi:hypothetical protein [Brevibacillus laterosporus]|uniref:hypothetical protein n=1 Tax=Brevibacillus laterosporus TaxID=1465 RepID=UPI00035CB381|nr:hypothetical protein [Brevibacillus laterosporus]ATO48401.1 hypothetical protein BrL25_04325 [Brevibacillus laterosporus DSM 25]MBG9789723.1 hypothetical protein [Brevibacillus laterosporus]MBG9803179.1 hypothetical protein [Brevibacillus laterosporus]MED2002134.1 hypothetical protein [Brevibacillus laterosporus]MED4765474.1 hypothetical protein [Brevibacillus laterosporus]